MIMTGLFSCATIPKGAVAVTPFNKEKYLGKWYEIARLDFKFEKDLNNTTAEYSLNDNGTIKVKNQGSKFVGADNVAMLKVSFFGPFYSGYNVIAIDDDYKYTLVAGASLKYLWILSRETNIPMAVQDKYLKIAEEVGYNTNNLVWVKHDK